MFSGFVVPDPSRPQELLNSSYFESYEPLQWIFLINWYLFLYFNGRYTDPWHNKKYIVPRMLLFFEIAMYEMLLMYALDKSL